MLSKNRISEIRKLSQKKFREESGLFIVEGTKSVMDLLRSKLIVNELYTTEGWMEKSGFSQLHRNIPCEITVLCECLECPDTCRDHAKTSAHEHIPVAHTALLDGVRLYI